jgi:hypothetical protein
MAEDFVTVPKASDAQVLRFLREVQVMTSDGWRSGHASINCYGAGLTLSEGDAAEIKAIEDDDLDLISQASVTFNGPSGQSFNVEYIRQGRDRKSPLFDELKFYRGNQGVPANFYIDVVRKVHSHFIVTSSEIDQMPGASILRESNQAISLTLELSKRIQNTGLRFTEGLVQLEEKLTGDLLNYKAALDEAAVKERQRLQAEYQQQFQSLADEQYKLELIRKEFETREPRHVRRQIRSDILKRVEKRSFDFSLTKTTQSLRKPVEIGLIVVFALFVAGSIFSLTQWGSALSQGSTTVLILLGLKTFFLTAGAAVSAYAYVRWQNKWFEQHAHAEFRLRQFELDIERASWLVETLQEWHLENKDPMPDALLHSLTRSMFVDDNDRADPLRHPADELASALLNSAASMKLNFAGNELLLDRKSIKGLNEAKDQK